jgi:hypothetical protein
MTASQFATALLLVLFVGFKLSGIIDWSWWWVLSPLWIPAAIGVTALAVYLAMMR